MKRELCRYIYCEGRLFVKKNKIEKGGCTWSRWREVEMKNKCEGRIEFKLYLESRWKEVEGSF